MSKYKAMHTFTKRRAGVQVNASSMADIAFLLLIFFLVTTTIDVETGIRVLLPEMENAPPPPINSRNIFSIKINFNDEVMVRGEMTEVGQIKEKTKKFITNPDRKANLAAAANQAIISLQNDRSTTYNIYLTVYNEIKAAYRELWEEEARQRFGISFKKLSRAKQKKIKEKIPMVISEGEVVDMK